MTQEEFNKGLKILIYGYLATSNENKTPNGMIEYVVSEFLKGDVDQESVRALASKDSLFLKDLKNANSFVDEYIRYSATMLYYDDLASRLDTEEIEEIEEEIEEV